MKPKIAMAWASSCGGCDVALLDTGALLLDLLAHCEVLFWPMVMDARYADVEALPDAGIDLCFFNGSLRTQEDWRMAQLLRRKSRQLVAFGVCAETGGIQALANASPRADLLRAVHEDQPGWAGPTLPGSQPGSNLPALLGKVHPLCAAVPVDGLVAGCPPSSQELRILLQGIIQGQWPSSKAWPLPQQALCLTCGRLRKESPVSGFTTTAHFQPDPKICFLDQGLVCLGPVTRGGCHEACLQSNMACRGCQGQAQGCLDSGAGMVGVLAPLLKGQDAGLAAQTLADPLGTFYPFTLGASSLKEPCSWAAPFP
jgi:F420-non-reducing hydrogenase small subunit